MKRPRNDQSRRSFPKLRLGGIFARLKKPGVLKKLAFTCLLFFMVGVGGFYGACSRACAGTACPSISLLAGYTPTQTAKVYAADGRLIAELGIERRTVVPLDEISPAVRAAFVASEDKRFFQHSGIDYHGIPRAAVANLREMRFAEGFSTITMQLARNVFRGQLPAYKDPRRKWREILVAHELERTYDKNKILELYLNQIFLGGNAYGVEAAAYKYFGKSARDLNVAEAATLAGITPGPTPYNPRVNPELALGRRNAVINLMRDQEYLTPEEAERWKAYPLKVSARESYDEVAPYFVEWIRQQLYDRFGTQVYERGFRVYTTLDLDMQIAAERAMTAQLEAIEGGVEFGPYRHLTYEEYVQEGYEGESHPGETPYLQGALVTLDAQTGYVRVMVGGRDFQDSEWNRVTQGQFQAGSTFKPFVFSAALRSGIPLSHIIDDAPISLRLEGDSMPWEPGNFDGKFMGPMTMRRGLSLSRNLVAVQLGMQLGTAAVIGEARRYGISSSMDRGHALHLGATAVRPIEMAGAYTAFATLGTRSEPIGVLRVEDENGNIIWSPQTRRVEVMDSEPAWLLTDVLYDVIRRPGATAHLRVRALGGFRHPAGGKTGTTNDGADVWFIGFTSELVTAVWIGFDYKRKIMRQSTGGRLAGPVWASYMNDVYERRAPPDDWDAERPASLRLVRIDHDTGFLYTGWCPANSTSYEWFIPGTEPAEPCPIHNPLRRGIPNN